jgi:hypothetical protein
MTDIGWTALRNLIPIGEDPTGAAVRVERVDAKGRTTTGWLGVAGPWILYTEEPFASRARPARDAIDLTRLGGAPQVVADGSHTTIGLQHKRVRSYRGEATELGELLDRLAARA